MPELPEVESFRKALEKEYLGKKIREVYFHRKDIRYPLTPQIKEVLRPGATITRFGRDGKQLIIETKYGMINVSLGMSGTFLPTSPNHPQKHEHVTIVFEDGLALGFIDPRRFGFWKVRRDPLPHLADPLDEEGLSVLFAKHIWNKRTRNIKDALMDQKMIGGVGNIYALEALHAAGIRPARSCGKITRKEYALLAYHLPRILERAIDGGGSTISTYRRLHGEDGNFQEYHHVYNRAGQTCLKKGCGGTIKRIVQGARGSWYCPKCQK